MTKPTQKPLDRATLDAAIATLEKLPRNVAPNVTPFGIGVIVCIATLQELLEVSQ